VVKIEPQYDETHVSVKQTPEYHCKPLHNVLENSTLNFSIYQAFSGPKVAITLISFRENWCLLDKQHLRSWLNPQALYMDMQGKIIQTMGCCTFSVYYRVKEDHRGLVLYITITVLIGLSETEIALSQHPTHETASGALWA